MKRLLRLGFLGGLLVSQFVFLVSGQEKIRTINDARHNFNNAPITVISREVGGKIFQGKQGVAGPDWLENLTLIIKNVSSKNIKRISILLKIPKQGSMEYGSGFYYPFPQGELIRTERGSLAFGQASLLILQPGATVKLRAWPHQLKILEVLKAQGVTDIGDVEISITQVTFDDGTGWFVGLPAVEDPSKPGSLFIVKPGTQTLQSSWWNSDWLSSVFSVASLATQTCPKSDSGFFLFAGLRGANPARPLSSGCGYSAVWA